MKPTAPPTPLFALLALATLLEATGCAAPGSVGGLVPKPDVVHLTRSAQTMNLGFGAGVGDAFESPAAGELPESSVVDWRGTLSRGFFAAFKDGYVLVPPEGAFKLKLYFERAEPSFERAPDGPGFRAVINYSALWYEASGKVLARDEGRAVSKAPVPEPAGFAKALTSAVEAMFESLVQKLPPAAPERP